MPMQLIMNNQNSLMEVQFEKIKSKFFKKLKLELSFQFGLFFGTANRELIFSSIRF